MANDFRHRLKRNPKPYRSSCSHIPPRDRRINALETTTDIHHQPQYSLSFNNKFHAISVSISENTTNQDFTETPVCSDNEDSDDDDSYYNTTHKDHNQWYMAFPDDMQQSASTKYIAITQSAPDIADDDMEQETELFAAKTLYPIRFQRHLHQLYSEGDGGDIKYNNKSIINEGEIMTMMGGTDNESLYSEGSITMDDEDMENEGDGYNIKQGITLMGNIQTNDMDLDEDKGSNITLMGHYDTKVSIGGREENGKSINEINIGITLMGIGEREDVSFIMYSMH